jgi:hypothetical protein
MKNIYYSTVICFRESERGPGEYRIFFEPPGGTVRDAMRGTDQRRWTDYGSYGDAFHLGDHSSL